MITWKCFYYLSFSVSFRFFASFHFLSAQNVLFVDVAGEMSVMREAGVMFSLKIVSVSLIKFIRSWYGWGGRELEMGVAVLYNGDYMDIFPRNIHFKIIQIQVKKLRRSAGDLNGISENCIHWIMILKFIRRGKRSSNE